MDNNENELIEKLFGDKSGIKIGELCGKSLYVPDDIYKSKNDVVKRLQSNLGKKEEFFDKIVNQDNRIKTYIDTITKTKEDDALLGKSGIESVDNLLTSFDNGEELKQIVNNFFDNLGIGK